MENNQYYQYHPIQRIARIKDDFINLNSMHPHKPLNMNINSWRFVKFASALQGQGIRGHFHIVFSGVYKRK